MEDQNAISWSNESPSGWNNLITGSLAAARDVAFNRLFGNDPKDVTPDRPIPPEPKNNLPLIIAGAAAGILLLVVLLKR